MTKLDGIQALAKDNSESGRQELLRTLTDLFVDSHDAPSDSQNAMFCEVVSKVLDDVVGDARIEFSKRVAGESHLPKAVALKLAWDEFEIASPILRHSLVLDDSDLVEISREKPQGHLLAISQRSSLGKALTDVLVVRGADIVVQTVAANSGADFSPNGYRSLVQKARSNPELQSALVDRTDMSRETAALLEPYLNAQLRNRLSDIQGGASNDIPNLVEKAKSKIEKVLNNKKQKNLEVDKILAAIKTGDMTLDTAVTQLATSRKPVPLATVISGVAKVPEKAVSSALLRVNGMPLAIMCKALDMSPEAFDAVSDMRVALLRLPAAISDRLTDEFDGIDRADARRTLDFLKTREAMADGME